MRSARHLVFASQAQRMPQDEDKPRITSNVRASLKLLKHFKSKMQEAAAGPKAATSYRRKRPEQKQEQQKQHQDHQEGIYSSLYDVMLKPILLVDGYNVCGTWEKLKAHWSINDLLTAREELISAVNGYVMPRGYRSIVVFDAYNSGLPFQRSTRGFVEVVYATDSTADKWIQHEIRVLRQEGYKRIIVVTSDANHRMGSLMEGAQNVWSSDRFIQDMETRKVSEVTRTRCHSIRLGYNLPANVSDKLLDLKRSLRQAEQAEKQKLKKAEKAEKQRLRNGENILPDAGCENIH